MNNEPELPENPPAPAISLHTKQDRLDAVTRLCNRVEKFIDDTDLDVGEILPMMQFQIQLLHTYTQLQSPYGDPFGPAPGHVPMRNSDVETWLKKQRDYHGPGFGGNDTYSESWYTLDNLLDEYRLRADVGKTLLDDLEPKDSIEVDPAPQPAIQPDIDDGDDYKPIEDTISPVIDPLLKPSAEYPHVEGYSDWPTTKGRGDIEP